MSQQRPLACVLSYWFNPSKYGGKLHLRATEVVLISLIPACFFPLFPPQHPSSLIYSTLTRTKNRLDTSKKKKSCLLLAHMEMAQIWWWREGAAEAWCRAEGQGLVPSRLASFQPRGTSVSAAEQSMGLSPLLAHHHHHHPPEDDRCSVLSLQQGENIRHLYNWLKMRERKREKKKRWKREKQGDRLCGCVFAHEWDIEHRVCILVAFSVCYNEI